MADTEHRDEPEEVDAEVVSEGGETEKPGEALAPVPAASHGGGDVVTLWNTRDPQEIVAAASGVATALKDVIQKQGLSKNLGGRKDHVEIEGWQTAGTLLGLQAMTVATRRVEPKAPFEVKTKRKKWGTVEGKRKIVEEDEHVWTCEGWSYEAVAEVRTLDGRVVGRGEAICSREEPNWIDSTDSAVKGMAQTRAQSRALKQALGFIVGLAGYNTTPQEEMDAAGVTGFELTAADDEHKQILNAALSYLIEGDQAYGDQAWKAIVAAFDGDLYNEAIDAVAGVIRPYKDLRERQAAAAAEAEKKPESKNE